MTGRENSNWVRNIIYLTIGAEQSSHFITNTIKKALLTMQTDENLALF